MPDNRFRKLTALLLCAAMLLTPLTGLAAGDKTSDTVHFIEIPGITREEYLARPVEDTGSVSLQAVDDGSLWNAAAQLREGMVAHKSSIDAKIYAPGFQWDVDQVWAFWNEVWSRAFANTGVPNEGDYLYNSWTRYSGSIRQGGSVITLTYYVNYFITAQQEAEFDAELDRVLSSLDLEGKSEFRKVETVYNWICGNIEYDYEHYRNADPDYGDLQHTAYAALKYRTCVCQGYAVLLYRMLTALGIGCRYIDGIGGEGEDAEGHAWNIIRIGKLWYNADSTWDSDRSGYGYFLVSDDNFIDHKPSQRYTTDEWNEIYFKSPIDYNAPPAEVSVDEVKLDRERVSIGVGESYKLTPTVVPENASNQNLIWNIAGNADKTVVKIDDGVVTGLKPGTVPVYALSVENPSEIAWCDVTVTGSGTYIPPEKIKAATRKLTLEESAVLPVDVTFRPENATDKRLRWSIDDQSVATVDQSGNVTAISEGVATLSIYSEADPWQNNPWLTDRITVKVVKPGYVETTGIDIDTYATNYFDIYKGERIDASSRIKFQPSNASDREIEWRSGNEKVATVDEYGMVTGVTHGYATLRASLKDDPGKFVNIGVWVNGDDNDQYDEPVYEPVNDPDVEFGNDTKYGNVLVINADWVDNHVTAKVMGVETGTYKFYIASYDSDGRLLGVTSHDLNLEQGEYADFEADAISGASRGELFSWDGDGYMPITEEFTFLEPYPENLVSTTVQERRSFHVMHGSKGKTVYTFTLRDNGSNDSGIMLGNSEVLNTGSDNYFRDGSIVILFAYGVIYTRDASSKNSVATYAVGSDVNIRIEANIPANTYDLWVNNKLAAGNVKFRTPTDVINVMAIVENSNGRPFNILNLKQSTM